MKVLIGMPSPDSWGGPISSEPPFVEALKKSGINVAEEVYVYGDKDKPTPLFQRIRRVVSTAYRFRRLLRRESFDLIHFNTAFDLKTILRDSFSLFLIQPKAKIFFKFHGSEAENFQHPNFLLRFLINYIRAKVDGFGIHTLEEKNNFLKIGFPQDKFYFVQNAITIHKDLDISERKKVSPEKFELLFVSRFIAAKGLLETIRACSVLRDQGFNFCLNCVGDGEVRIQAEEEVKKLKLESFVKFTGYISENEVSAYFFNSDLFVFPTRHAEGFPNVLFKAVAVGMPIVTTKVRAAADYLVENENALFCTQEPNDIAEKIAVLLQNLELRQRMSSNNIKFGKKLLPEAIAQSFIEIYQKILES